MTTISESNLRIMQYLISQSLDMTPETPPRSDPAELVLYLKENPVIIDTVAEIVARYRFRLNRLGVDDNRAGDIAKNLSSLLWNTILENIK